MSSAIDLSWTFFFLCFRQPIFSTTQTVEEEVAIPLLVPTFSAPSQTLEKEAVPSLAEDLKVGIF